MLNSFRGIWFTGKAGVGKTTASKIFKSNSNLFVIVDGDEVRKYVSYDLGYELKDRKVQILRMYGIANLILQNNLIPVISTVYMDEKGFNLCQDCHILVVNISRPFNQLEKIRPIYRNTDNVVGYDIDENIIYNEQINNSGSDDFFNLIEDLCKRYFIGP